MKSRDSTTSKAGMAMLICHRWFSSGEGWAWSNSIAGPVRKKVLDVLRHDLPALREVSKEPRHYMVAGGTLLVSTVEDTECPDPLARSRHPVLVAAVFIPGARPKDVRRSDAEELFGKVEQVCRGVVAPGGASGLQLCLPETLTNIIRRRRTMRYIGLLAAFAVIGGGCIAFAQVGKILHPEADEKNIGAWASASEAQLDRWGVEVEQPKAASVAGDTQSGAVNDFLKLLCRKDQWEQLDSEHPDGEFLCRLPKSAVELDRNPKESDVRSAMTNLLNHLGTKRPAKEEQREPEAVIADIARCMDYRDWYTGKARIAVFNGRVQCLPEEQRRYIYRFCPPSTGLEDGGLCKALYQIMTSQWGVKGLCEEDLRQRPWFVAGCFFEFASLAAIPTAETPATQPAASQSTGDSAKRTDSAALQRLRKYLPRESLLDKADLRRDNLDRPLKAAIRALARQLDVPTSGRDDRTILEDVRVRLKQIAESALETASSENPPEPTRWYLERLTCPGPAPTSKPVDTGAGE